jgi:hypothetical protein
LQRLYEYKKKLPHAPHGGGEEETLVIDGEREFVDSFIEREEFHDLFGGSLFTQDAQDPPTHFQYRGVWGRDKVRKFKRVMRERGAQFEVAKIDGASRIVKVTSRDLPSSEWPS